MYVFELIIEILVSNKRLKKSKLKIKNIHIWFWKKTCKLTKKFLRLISHNNNLLTLLLTLVSLYVAYKSLKLSDLSLKYSVEQNEINSKASDSLFKVQLLNSKTLNDSIINEINRLRNITNNQLSITEKQLIELKTQSKPRIALTEFWININSYSTQETMSELTGNLTLLNIGSREAHNLKYISFVINSDFSKISDLSKGSILSKLNSEEKYNFELSIKSKHEISDLFYIYLRIYYFDLLLNKIESNEYFYKKMVVSDDINTYKCNFDEVDKILKVIKQKSIIQEESKK